MTHRIALIGSLICLISLSCQHQQIITETSSRWLRIRHAPLEEAKVGTDAPIEVEVESSANVNRIEAFLFFKAEQSTFDVTKMQPIDGGRFFTTVPSQPRGTVVEYYIEVRGDGDLVARIPQKEEGNLELTYKGIPSRTLLLAHVVLIFVCLALFLLVGFLAVKALGNRQIALHIPRLALLATVIFFISSFPLGMIVAYQTYGKAWTGFPLGSDFTDNKSLAIILYFVISTILYKGSAMRRDASADALPIRTIPYVYLVGVCMIIVLFAIPH